MTDAGRKIHAYYIEYLERTAQPPKVSDIADLLQVTRPGITRLVSELQAINVIEKSAMIRINA